ncbi:helix-turn-helix domain-containing protein [Rhodococcus pseudokoreensis]|uniref:Helix-turn-helix domain-containing protein n=1 Tax=Rhodococcus pseudokoreensis TaxID=2811421 RepID=A0A974W7W7_9NOCA|nr:helix-turn-helix domain-containing protein [Rhodococcus pseudokoreensis]QSE92776.1 helix-turn-helix domain-containing protein [Rhodococcus pseudokoreensis]
MEQFDIDTVRHEDRGEWWADVLSRTCHPLDLTVTPSSSLTPFRARARRHWLDDLSLVDAECDPCSGSTRPGHIADNRVAVLLVLSGCEAISQGNETTLLRAGDAVLWGSQEPIEFEVLEPLHKRTLLIPRAALDEVSGWTWPTSGVTLHGGSAAVRLLASYLAALADSLGGLDPSAISSARNAALDLLIGAAATHAGGQTCGSETLRSEIDNWVDDHLLDPGLSISTAAEAHSVSVRTVQRTFGMFGETFSGALRAKRLARSRDDLRGATDSITSIACRWGFSDASHFSRQFKAKFGVAPSVYRSEARSTSIR